MESFINIVLSQPLILCARMTKINYCAFRSFIPFGNLVFQNVKLVINLKVLTIPKYFVPTHKIILKENLIKRIPIHSSFEVDVARLI